MPPARIIIYKDSALWIEYCAKVNQLEKILATSAATINRTERALMGGWDETGTQWVEGLRDKLQHVDEKVEAANRQANKFLALGQWAVGVLSAIFIGLVVDLSNSYFGWFGAAHQTLHH
jgi:hypothetical protein